MKIYINAYAKKRKKLNKTMDKYGELIAEHLAKCAMYGDTLKNGKYKHPLPRVFSIRYTSAII